MYFDKLIIFTFTYILQGEKRYSLFIENATPKF
jgi:hypothetical protein